LASRIVDDRLMPRVASKVKGTPVNKTVLGAVTICAGAPLLALVVGTANAWADTSPGATDASTTEPIDDRSLAISVGGITLVKTGRSEAFTLGPSIAIAYNNSQAGAMGLGNVAIATNNSYSAAAGVLNIASADNNSDASAGYDGIGNTAIARNGSSAGSYDGNFNSASATNNSSAQIYIGSFNTVTATDGSIAILSGDANRVTARCGGSVTLSAQGQIVTSAPCEAG
jgi:hypothetical protein